MTSSAEQLLRLEPAGVTLVLDQTGTVRSVTDARALGGQQLDNAVTGCHISTLFPKPTSTGHADIPLATADAAIQHMFGAALELNAAARTLGSEPAERIVKAIGELDCGIRVLRDNVWPRAIAKQP